MKATELDADEQSPSRSCARGGVQYFGAERKSPGVYKAIVHACGASADNLMRHISSRPYVALGGSGQGTWSQPDRRHKVRRKATLNTGRGTAIEIEQVGGFDPARGIRAYEVGRGADSWAFYAGPKCEGQMEAQ
jgi:hypothetical protein